MEKKSRLLQIKRYLEERTDEAHPSAIADILSYLESEGVPADRRTVSRDIEMQRRQTKRVFLWRQGF